jgi:hypothetical protein
MATINFKEILTTNSLDEGRIITNENIRTVYTSFNDLLNYVDLETKSIQGINKIDVFTVTNPNVASLNKVINTNGVVYAKGGISTDNDISGYSLVISGDDTQTDPVLNLQKGNAALGNRNSKHLVNGLCEFNGRFVQTVMIKTNAHLESSYVSPGVETSGTEKVAVISTNSNSILILDFTGYTTSTHISNFRISTTDAVQGQIVHIIVKKTSTPTNIVLKNNNIICPTLASQSNFNGINFTNNYQSAKFLFDGQNWILIDLFGATIISA